MGRRIRYADIGQGPAVVLVHGQGGSWQWWLRIMPAIASHCRVIALDLPGFGESDPVETDDVFAELAETIRSLLDHLKVARTVIVGHSMGGLVCLRVACDNPGLVSGLALVDAGGGNLGRKRLKLILTAFRFLDALFAVPLLPALIAQRPLLRGAIFAVAVHDSRSLSTPLAMQIIPRMAAPGFTRSLQAGAAAVDEATPEHVMCPSLVIWGARDRILPLSSGRRLASELPDARFAALPGVGHCAMFEAPEQVTELLAEFIRDPVNGRPNAPEEVRAVHIDLAVTLPETGFVEQGGTLPDAVGASFPSAAPHTPRQDLGAKVTALGEGNVGLPTSHEKSARVPPPPITEIEPGHGLEGAAAHE
ncbi:alpha/beta fold hydrolase [Mycolicibacterium hodleri]|nr:alpha/beta fold hydrolase [Mycolicibacterium hodleri]